MPDFLPESDSNLIGWTLGFSNQLTQAPGDFGVLPQDAAHYALLQQQFADAFRVAISPKTNSGSAIFAKNTARALLKDETRRLVRVIRAAGVEAARLANLGLKPPRKAVRRLAIPRSRPQVQIVRVEGRRVVIRLTDSDQPSRRGKPRGVAGAIIYTFMGEAPPSELSQWDMTALVSSPRTFIRFGTKYPAGAQIWFCARWLNPRLQAGGVSNTVSTHIGGGVEIKDLLRLAA